MTKYNNQTIFDSQTFVILFVLLLSLLSCPCVFGQKSAKRNLTQSDYDLWHKLGLEEISDDGNWVSFHHYYANTDTLFVQHRISKKKMVFAKGNAGTFKGNRYICGTPDGVLYITNLKSGDKKVIKEVQQFTAYGSFIIITQVREAKNAVVVIDYNGKELFTVNDVIDYQGSPDEKYVSIVKREEALNVFSLLSTKGFTTTELIKQPADQGVLSMMRWSANSNAVALYDTKGTEAKIHYYDINRSVLHTFTNAFAGFPSSMNFYTRAELNLTADGNRVFFKIRQKPELNVNRPAGAVQVWNTKDAQIYPSAIVTEGFTQNPRNAMWEPHHNRFVEITDNTFPVGGTGGNSAIAVVYNPLTHIASDKFTHDADIYVTTLSDGKRKMMAEHVIGGSTNVFVSPTGKYVAYFDKGQWHIYAVATGIVTNITKNMAVSFSIESQTEQGENNYGNAGWSLDDAFILLYDEYDIWKIKPDGSQAERLTKGREEGIKYRLLAQDKGQFNSNDGRILTVGTFDLNSKLLLKSSSLSNDFNGFAVWHPGNKLQQICYVPKSVSVIAQSGYATFVWIEEDVAQPPTLRVRKGNAKAETLHASNKQQQQYNWTKVEMLHYKNSEGTALKGMLYYPSGYVAGKMYPMVVHIYQKQSGYLHKYTPPTLENSDGFNATNLSAKGYFVLLPDITYTVGEIGASAVDCVEAAVRKALENPLIDAKNVGLIGHSFGGTQTDFIITQSSLFKCAVAGSATTDFISSHLSVTPNYKIPNFYKIERGQARMMVSPFEDWERYVQNSAVYHAAKITTPLLSWTGLKDGQVDYTQSFEFYLALRRLKKEHTMLVYPNAEHDLSGSKDAADLTSKIEDWFDYHLKKGAKPAWL